MKLNATPCINGEIFLDYVQIVFLLNFAELWRLDEFAEQLALLLMEHWSGQLTNDVINLLTEARVRVITVAPYTAQIFQVLDVTLFGVLKRHTRCELPFGDEKATVKVIIKPYHDFKQTMVEPNRWRVFQALGFEFDIRNEAYRLFFNKEKLRESEDF
jgi:hypothetical protein